MSALKILFSLFFLLFIANLFIFIPSASAETPSSGPCVLGWCPLNSNNYDDEIATQRFGRNVLVFGHVALFGTNPMNGEAYSEKVSYKTENGKTVAYSTPGIGTDNPDGGALGLTTNAIASLYNPPTSSVEYLANIGESIGISPKSAYAQGVEGSGNNVIKPVYALWQVMRNIAYVAFILIFIAAGMMIMFRQKLNPQTVIGIQQALPGLVIGLIMVTFSYFIAAFIVDLTFVGTRLVAEIFIMTNQPNYYGCTEDITGISPCTAANSKIGILNTYNKSDAFYMYGHVGSRINNVSDVFGQSWATFSPKAQTPPGPSGANNKPFWEIIPEKIGDAVGGAFRGAVGGGPLGLFAIGPIGFTVGMWSGLLSYNIGQFAGAGLISTLAAILVPLILGIALMIQFVRLILALLMSYLQILIMVIFGPFLILFSAIPGKGGVLGYWFKSLLANVLVFPAVFAGFLFAGMLLQWNNAGLKDAAMPMFGGLGPDILKSLLAFGVLLGLPSIPDMVRQAMGVKGPEGFTKAALGGFMGGLNAGRSMTTGGYKQGMSLSGLEAEKQAYERAKLEARVATLGKTPQTTNFGGRAKNVLVKGFDALKK